MIQIKENGAGQLLKESKSLQNLMSLFLSHWKN